MRAEGVPSQSCVRVAVCRDETESFIRTPLNGILTETKKYNLQCNSATIRRQAPAIEPGRR